MAISLTDPAAIERNETFTATITPTVADEVITDIACIDSDSPQDSGITISTSSSAITLSGSYEDAFDQDEIKSFPSDKSIMLKDAVFDSPNGSIIEEERELTTEEFELKQQEFPNIVQPTTSTSFASVPDGHIVFSAIQDSRTSVTKTYTATISYNNAEGVAQTPEVINFNHIVNTSTTTFSAKLKELYPDE